MNNKFKKGALALGTIATIAAPVAAVVSCGATANTINWKDSDTYGGVSSQEFLNQIKHLGKTKQNAVTVGKEQMMELQYQSESIRSIMAQLEDFRYQNWQTEMENNKLVSDQDDAKKDNDTYLKSVTTDGSTDESKVKDSKKDEWEAVKKTYEEKNKSLFDSQKENDDKIVKTEGFIKKIEAVKAKITTTGDYLEDDKDGTVAAFYKDEYNSTDYPEVYRPLSAIHDEKKAVIEDAYKNFYPEFNTRYEGDAEWPNELAANYGNAATFDQAVNYLVSQEISSKAFNSYKFELNKGFDVEKKLWAKYIDKDAYKFLINDGADVAGSVHSRDIDEDVKAIIGTGTDAAIIKNIEDNILLINKGELVGTRDIKASVLSSVELFIGSTSPDHRMPEGSYDGLGKVVKYQHMLIKATQGKTPEELWTITADDLKKLMEFTQYSTTKDATGAKVEQGLDLLTENLFDGTDTDFTDFVLGAISGNSAGTLKTQGSLGIKSETEYLKTMVPGFSLGALAITQGGDLPVAGVEDLDLSGLIKNLKDALKKEVEKEYTTGILDSVDKDSLSTVNSDIDSVITTLGDDKVKVIFGQVFENFFKDKKKLVYKLITPQSGTTSTVQKDLYLVISQYGLHIIKRSSYAGSTEIKGALDGDLENMATDSSLSSSTSIVSELNSYFTETKVMETLIHKPTDKEGDRDMDEATDTPYIRALKARLAEYNKDLKDDVDKVEYKDVADVIDAVNKLASKTAVDGAIGDKLENWLVTQMDSGLRTIGTLKLTDIYDWAKTAGGIK